MTEAVPPISDELVNRIERALEGVTPGPWSVLMGGVAVAGATDTYSGPVWGAIVSGQELFQTDEDGRAWTARGDRAKNLDHIANCDPDTIRSLIARLRASEAVKAEVAETWPDLPITDEELLRIRNECEHEDGQVKIWSKMLQMIVDHVRATRAHIRAIDRAALNPGQRT